jgi:hypothetical protein
MIVPYTYRVIRGADDSTWLATCAEFPGPICPQTLTTLWPASNASSPTPWQKCRPQAKSFQLHALRRDPSAGQ